MKNTVWIIIAISFIAFFTYGYLKGKKVTNTWYVTGYSGIVEDIKTFEDNRGDPSILLSGKWKTIGKNEDKIRNYIKIGDSIFKFENSEKIIVYRQDSGSINIWKSKEFE